MAGMEIETYGTECSEEFDYDDEVDYEEDGEVIEKIARLKKMEELEEELKKQLMEISEWIEKNARLEKENEEHNKIVEKENSEWIEKNAKLEKENEELKKIVEKENSEWIEKNARLEKENEELKKIVEKEAKLMEKLGERTETIAWMTEELARVNSGIALLSDLGCFPEGIPRIDDEALKRLEDDTARKRSELGFLPRYDPPEKEEMFTRALKDCILLKRQEIKAKKSGEMPADAPGLNMRRQMAMFLV